MDAEILKELFFSLAHTCRYTIFNLRQCLALLHMNTLLHSLALVDVHIQMP